MALNIKAIFTTPYSPIVEQVEASYLAGVLAVQSSSVNTELLQEGDRQRAKQQQENIKDLKKLLKKRLNML